MTRARRFTLGLICAVTVSVSGCAQTPPPLVSVVTAEPRPLVTPPECNPASDPKWTDLPDADVRRSEAVRTIDHNGDAFDDVADNRSICWAALKARTSPDTAPQ